MAILQTHSDTRTRNFTNLPLGTSKRVLIISPHPDDETISAGGLIQVALDLGAEVKIVIVTNGDGQVFAPLVLKGQFRPRPADFIAHGERRQSEAIASLIRLGVSPRDIFFLGYPDRGLNALWLGDWTNKCPMRAAYTKAITSPYSIAFNHQARYCGSDLLADLQTIFQNYSPDFVVLPHPNDEHPDHRAISNFVRLMLALQIMVDVKYHVEAWGYLIHYGSYPQPRGLHINRSLLLPKLSSSENIKWAILNLTAQQVQVKYAAVQSYITQRRLLGSFLPTFIRPNENFINLCIPDFVLSKESSFIIPRGKRGGSSDFPEAATRISRRLLMLGASSVEWSISRQKNVLFVVAKLHGRLIPGLRCRLLIKSPNGYTRRIDATEVLLRRGTFMTQMGLNDMGDPVVLGFAAEVQWIAMLTQTAWWFAIIKYS